MQDEDSSSQIPKPPTRTKFSNFISKCDMQIRQKFLKLLYNQEWLDYFTKLHKSCMGRELP